MYISFVVHHLFSIHWLMIEQMYENMIISFCVWCYRHVWLVDDSLVLNQIISRRISVLKNKTFGTQRYAIVHHDSNESYEIHYYNSIYNNDYKVTSAFSSFCTCLSLVIIEMLLLVIITSTLHYASIVFMYRFHNSSYWLSPW